MCSSDLVTLAAFNLLRNSSSKPLSSISKILISISSLIGLFVTSRQIYIQSMSLDELVNLSGCGMPFHAQVDYFGLIEAINRTLAGGPSCAEDGWRFIFNFADSCALPKSRLPINMS